jgi:hypothetical protein
VKLENELLHQEKTINNFKKEINEKLDAHKTATDLKLTSINNTLIETKTLVSLLVNDRIKQHNHNNDNT